MSRFNIVRWLVVGLSVLILASAHATTTAAATVPRSPADTKVVIIVGPTGDVTDHYRADADEAAAVARRYTSSVITLYSPDATWARVRTALQGASVVVYLGHGNGYPSPHRSSPWPYTENGLGLNVAGSASDDEHQYFGEYYLRQSVKLAPDAVVILSHLCYASGSSEPGLPNDGLDVAVQRVDNYAAGFLATGASAVITDAHIGPAYYVDQVLGAHRGVAAIWDAAPTFHDHVLARDSERSPGYREYLDPDNATSGYYRSMVVRPGLSAKDIRDGGKGTRKIVPVPVSVPPTPSRPPAVFGVPLLSGAPAAGHTVRVTLPIASGAKRLPADMTFNVRWDPLAVEGTTTPPSSTTTGAAPPPSDPPASESTWIEPERQGDVVQTEVAAWRKTKVTARVLVPQAVGVYRLTISASDGDGVDLPSGQALQPGSYLVHVIPALDITYATSSTMDIPTGAPTALPVRLTNSGADSWWVADTSGEPGAGTLKATWVALGVNSAAMPAPSFTVAPFVAAGSSADVALRIVAPRAPGDYLLVLDVLTPDGVSMAATGVPPQMVLVKVHRAPLSPPEESNPYPSPRIGPT